LPLIFCVKMGNPVLLYMQTTMPKKAEMTGTSPCYYRLILRSNSTEWRCPIDTCA
jgi:hypothetical protein